MSFKLREYLSNDGRNPFRDWLKGVVPAVSARIQARLFRMEQGNLGDYKRLGHGILEARCDFGPGYRIYFGIDGREVIILLAGGDKGSQGKDITRAAIYWADYLNRKSNDSKKH